ncbi:MAG: hypothetical protein ACO3AF_00835 [Flavobacteriales bacterium]
MLDSHAPAIFSLDKSFNSSNLSLFCIGIENPGNPPPEWKGWRIQRSSISGLASKLELKAYAGSPG